MLNSTKNELTVGILDKLRRRGIPRNPSGQRGAPSNKKKPAEVQEEVDSSGGILGFSPEELEAPAEAPVDGSAEVMPEFPSPVTKLRKKKPVASPY